MTMLANPFNFIFYLLVIYYVISIVLSYVVLCYLLYRIVAKFKNGISFAQMLVPVLNLYRVLEVAFGKPVPLFTMLWTITIGGSFMAKILALRWLLILTSCINYGVIGYVLGSIARKLGKNFLIYSIFGFIPFTNFIVCIALAFSRKTEDSK